MTSFRLNIGRDLAKLHRVRSAVEKLPPVQRELFEAVVVDGDGLAATATRLGLNAEDAEASLVAALLAVQASLDARGRVGNWRSSHRLDSWTGNAH